MIDNSWLSRLTHDVLPHETIAFACAYGSGAVQQYGEDRSSKMIDLIVVTRDTERFHAQNIRDNPEHYSLLRYSGAGRLTQLQREYAARVYCNTRVKYEDRLIKYSVIELEDFYDDLLHWRWLYIAGRLQKYVINVIEPDQDLQKALNKNRLNAIQAALLLLPEKFSLDQFYDEIVSLSYRGDFRMWIGEDRNKVRKIVDGSKANLYTIYAPLLEADDRITIQGSNVEQEWSAPTLCNRILQLPRTVHYYLQKVMNKRSGTQYDVEELATILSYRLDASKHISYAIEQIVRQSAWQQTFKNALSAGLSRSMIYSATKLFKMLKSMRPKFL